MNIMKSVVFTLYLSVLQMIREIYLHTVNVCCRG